MLSQEEIEALPVLGLSYVDFVRLERLPREEAKEALEKLKADCKKAYKEAVKQLHPDQNGGDSEKTAMFRRVTELSSKISSLEFAEYTEYEETYEWNPTPVGYDMGVDYGIYEPDQTSFGVIMGGRIIFVFVVR